MPWSEAKQFNAGALHTIFEYFFLTQSLFQIYWSTSVYLYIAYKSSILPEHRLSSLLRNDIGFTVDV